MAKYSKLKCVAVLKKAGVWEQARAWIEASGLYDEYLAAQDFAADNEYFKQGKSQLAAALGWTEEFIDTLLGQCFAEE